MLGELWSSVAARTGLDLFAGTTRVAQEFKRRGGSVTAVDSARYAHVFAQTYVATDAEQVDRRALDAALVELGALPGVEGYVTETFCRQARFFHPRNGARIDAIRAAIGSRYGGSPLEPLLLTSLIEAADRVDSTTGVQMAFLKTWAARAHNDLALRAPELLPGPGRAVLGDATALVGGLGSFDLAYLDPPYNQHRYTANYHVWETLAAGDEPECYGVARKRAELQDKACTSVFNRKRQMPTALAEVIEGVDAGIVVVSYNDESWVGVEELCAMGEARGEVAVVAFDSRRYVGATIGIHSPDGVKVGTVGRLRNLEYLMICGERDLVRRAHAAVAPTSVNAGLDGLRSLPRSGR